MNARELIAAVIDSITSHRVVVIISFLLSLVGVYVLAPQAWHDFFLGKTPAFVPFGINLFDVIALAFALTIALVVHAIIRRIALYRHRSKRLNAKKIQKIIDSGQITGEDYGYLVAMALNIPFSTRHFSTQISKHKLKEAGLIRVGHMGNYLVKDEVKAFIFEKIESKEIDPNSLFPGVDF